jgi:hypothetical protein
MKKIMLFMSDIVFAEPWHDASGTFFVFLSGEHAKLSCSCLKKHKKQLWNFKPANILIDKNHEQESSEKI